MIWDIVIHARKEDTINKPKRTIACLCLLLVVCTISSAQNRTAWNSKTRRFENVEEIRRPERDESKPYHEQIKSGVVKVNDGSELQALYTLDLIRLSKERSNKLDELGEIKELLKIQNEQQQVLIELLKTQTKRQEELIELMKKR